MQILQNIQWPRKKINRKPLQNCDSWLNFQNKIFYLYLERLFINFKNPNIEIVYMRDNDPSNNENGRKILLR